MIQPQIEGTCTYTRKAIYVSVVVCVCVYGVEVGDGGEGRGIMQSNMWESKAASGVGFHLLSEVGGPIVRPCMETKVKDSCRVILYTMQTP